MYKKIILYFFFLNILAVLIAQEKIRDFESQISFIDKLGEKFNSTIIGVVEYYKTQYPVYKISYNKQENLKNKKYLIIAGVHGNEPAPVYAIKEFLLELDTKEVSLKNVQIDFLYIVSPWAFVYNQRYNALGEEINRDLNTLKTQEAKIIANNFNPRDYEKVFDFHEANSDGFFLYCYGSRNKKSAKRLIKILEEKNVILETGYKDVILKAKKGILYVPFYGSLYMSLKNKITVGQYFIRCRNSFTFETSKKQKLDERKRIIKIILENIVKGGF